MKLNFSLLFLLFSLLIFPVSGQEKSVSDTKDKPNLQQKTSALIEEILLENSVLESKENQIVISILMIDLLWARDQNRARQLTRQTADKIRSELAPADESSSIYQFPPKKYGDLRHDFLLALVRHDLSFARQMALYTLPLMPKFPPTNQSEQNQLRNWRNDERDLEQKLAFQAAAQNIGEARKMASESLTRGVTDESLNTLRRFHLRDSAAADSFADELIQKLTESDFAKNEEAQKTTAMFFGQLDEKRGVFGMPRSCNCPARPLNLDAQKARKLAAKWLDFAINSKDENISNWFLSVMPVLQKLLPEQNAAIQSKFASIKKSHPQKVEGEQLREQLLDDKTSPETIAAQALKKTDNERFHLYRQAFIKAANNSKAALEKLLAAISEHPGSEEKNWLTDQINANLSGKTAEDGDLDKALQMAQKVVSRDRRLGLLSFLALEFLKKGEADKAKQISDEIAVLLDLKTKDKLPKAIVGYDIFPTLFRTFALIDTERAFILLENVMPESNDLLARSFRNSSVDNRIDLRSLLRGNSYILPSYSKPLKNLAEKDFDRTKSLIAYLEKAELIVMAKLLIAQALTHEKLGFGDFDDRREMIILKN